MKTKNSKKCYFLVTLITIVSIVLPIVLLACEESTSGNGTDTDTKPTAIKKVSIEEFTLNALKDIAIPENTKIATNPAKATGI